MSALSVSLLHHPAPAPLAALEAAASPHGWSARQYQDSLQAGHLVWGIGQEDELQGFAVVMMVLDEAELLNIVVAAPHQGKGLGHALLAHLLGQLAEQGCQRLLLEVRESNQAARRLYQRCGFVESGLRKHYYPTATGREHAILMECKP